jgi:hypothetical protein
LVGCLGVRGRSPCQKKSAQAQNVSAANAFLDRGTGLFLDLDAARQFIESLPGDGTVEELQGYPSVYVRPVGLVA